MELAPFLSAVKQLREVAKASLGHYPLPFLISEPVFYTDVKRTAAKLAAKTTNCKISLANSC
jgi:hypothetical protein